MQTNIVPIIWGQNFAPDLLESIMKPSRLAKEGLRRILMQTIQFNSKGIFFVEHPNYISRPHLQCPDTRLMQIVFITCLWNSGRGMFGRSCQHL